MSAYEYKVVPAPRQGKSARGVKGVEAKFANALSTLMNEMGAAGWQYQRADTLPCEERQGLTGKTVNYHSMLIFRRPIDEEIEQTLRAAERLALAPPAEEDWIDEPVEYLDDETQADQAQEWADAPEDASIETPQDPRYAAQ